MGSVMVHGFLRTNNAMGIGCMHARVYAMWGDLGSSIV